MNTTSIPRSSAPKPGVPMPAWIPWTVIGVSSLIVLLMAWQAFDILLLLVFVGVVFLVERTVGDWLQDAVGPVLSKVIFLGLAVFLMGAMLSFDRIRATVWNVIDTADSWGFHSVLMDRIPGRPAVAPVTGDGVVGNHNPTAPIANTPVSGDAGSGSSGGVVRQNNEPTRSPTRIALRVGSDREVTLVQVDVVAAGGPVNDGEVEFLVDGRVVATVAVSNGVAQARLTGIAPGTRTAAARYTGTSRHAASVTQSSFRR